MAALAVSAIRGTGSLVFGTDVPYDAQNIRYLSRPAFVSNRMGRHDVFFEAAERDRRLQCTELSILPCHRPSMSLEDSAYEDRPFTPLSKQRWVMNIHEQGLFEATNLAQLLAPYLPCLSYIRSYDGQLKSIFSLRIYGRYIGANSVGRKAPN